MFQVQEIYLNDIRSDARISFAAILKDLPPTSTTQDCAYQSYFRNTLRLSGCQETNIGKFVTFISQAGRYDNTDLGISITNRNPMKVFAFNILMMISFSGTILCQDIVEKTYPLKPGQKVSLNLKFAKEIKVMTWKKNEVFLRSEVNINDGTLNEAHKIDILQLDTVLQIVTDFDQAILRKAVQADCEDKAARSFFNFDDTINGAQYWICSSLSYFVYVPAESDLKIETVSGNINITDLKGSLEAKSISGYIEMNSAADQGATFVLKSLTGNVASDFAVDESELKKLIARELKGHVNGGGRPIYLESVSGNVFLRKTK